ncbi:YceI family protein [Neomicrococcus aestuarii]|uniref:Polyisoprenoid-binding protein n=1 Tax=Neomicrococcus aestuarii TaxID=556325 RepID=A0A1L2ZPP9_9MICC|nr:YceI family protein [Neomicrococcus aestuarii]APF41364.1 polyisoprenoid-binding protein [Neomicrococcus aestuarii]MBB5513294.1 polyisoprenoid-binding protein YceI [Neomicrococcus aestuarii]
MTDLDSSLSGVWNLDPSHSRVGFQARHAMVTKVRGAFNDVQGRIELDAQNISNTKVDFKVRVESIDTRNADRDNHLRTNDFFDAQTHPYITFVSTNVDQVDENSFIVSGDLTIRGVTKPVTVPLELTGIQKDQNGSLRAGFEGSRRIDRRDFGLEWNVALDQGGVLVSERISLEFELSAVKEG